ncbi:hypothetical protein [Streptomyces sp. NBC_00582]|uniref:hypothetical protein n=1 Tax=Streptomyces sp. NBC_00582 TaxID=2975783 RepID=UPI002E805E3E|nr:hypothetical protein [Streptomyces sp. NBC_00582]WUB59778.1 hypothetical protein OG852_04920 [Streptomyces sp. NBC_00582]
MTVPHEDHADYDRDDYSATALDSFWVERGDDGTTVVHARSDDGTTVVHARSDDGTAVMAPRADDGTALLAPRADDGTAVMGSGADDRTAVMGSEPDDEPTAGSVLRFGPGVTARPGATAGSVYPVRTVTVPAAPPARRHRRLRRHALPALVLVAAVLFLLWRQHDTPGLSVRGVSAAAGRGSTGCDTTADVVGVVRTDGHAGELSYRWVRNDGTESDVLHARVAEGRRTVRLHLLWTFQGQGHYAASAELRVLSPGGGTARAAFTYDCL